MMTGLGLRAFGNAPMRGNASATTPSLAEARTAPKLETARRRRGGPRAAAAAGSDGLAVERPGGQRDARSSQDLADQARGA